VRVTKKHQLLFPCRPPNTWKVLKSRFAVPFPLLSQSPIELGVSRSS